MALKVLKITLTTILVFGWFGLSAQKTDSLKTKKSPEKKSGIQLTSILTYVRVIRDDAGNSRIDFNFVPDIRLNKYLNLELGFRQGAQTYVTSESPQYGAYNHYKIELQTKRVKTFRLFARLTDNIVRNPDPTYSRTNYVLAIDGKPRITRNLTALLAYGYVFSYEQLNKLEATPIAGGKETNYPIFKIGLHYSFWDKGQVGFDYGSYDTFNPYLLTDPFTQISFEYELSKRVSFYSYYRRVYFNSYGDLLSRYFTGGVIIHLAKKVSK